MNEITNAVIPINQLAPHPRNYNTHGDAQIGDLRLSLRKFGQVRSIVVQATAPSPMGEGARSGGEGRYLIVAGHGLCAAARLEKYTSLRADVIPAEWDEARVLAYLAADNELARQGTPDEAQLAAIVAELSAANEAELARLAAGNEARLKELLAANAAAMGGGGGDAEQQIDRAAELNEKWKVKTGDLWRIGDHRLLCGDSEQGIDRIRGDYTIDAVISDPPYGINIVRGLSPAAIGGAKPFGRVRQPGGRQPKMVGKVGGPGVVEPRLYRPVANDDKPFDPAWLLDLADVCILFGANHFASRLPDSPAWIVWEKNVSDQSTFSACELAWCNVGNHVRRYEWTWSGMVRAGDREVEMKDRIHPTQKPVGMIEKIIQDFTDERAIVADPYLGSGTTMMAAARTNRVCVGGELDEAYCAVILERMSMAFPGIVIERIE